ncbi:EG45-like domain containing protein [Camellia lanceoleosa]|uniref:EG45-like domain containing protein n=1 Tax=Camellia lanceoleosa TaxID=1840588 RepID=A0ACC0HYE7_9ERIC|nr:EG45-like domain containing protein [Camellia lanceoleosa]
MRAIILVCIAASLISVASAIAGTATYYNVYVPSACYGYQDQGVMIAAASDALWNNGAACGKMYSVSCTGATNQGPQPCKSGSVTVKIETDVPHQDAKPPLISLKKLFPPSLTLQPGKSTSITIRFEDMEEYFEAIKNKLSL